MELIPHTLELADGTRLEYLEQPGETRPNLVFVHGWPDSCRSFESVISALSPGSRSVAPSLRGFGRSDSPDGGYTMPELAADVAELIERLDAAPAILVGHSMGSVISQRIAIDRPELVAGLVLVGGFSRLERPVAEEITTAIADLDDPIDEVFTREFVASTLEMPVTPEFFEQLVAESRSSSARVWRATFAAVSAADHRAELDQIPVPTLLLFGDRDALVPRAEQDRLLAGVPDATLEVYEGVGHSPNWEQPDRVAGDIDAFARRVLGDRALS